MKLDGRNTSRSQRGFTLLETMMALGLSGLVMLAGYEMFTSYTNRFKQIGDTLDIATDIETGQQIMLRDLKALSPSYGLLGLRDDQNQLFLEYFPDVPEKALPQDPACGRPCRTYTMKAVNGFAEVTLLLEDPSASDVPSMVYDPTWAFTLHVPPDNIHDAAPPTYGGVNRFVSSVGGPAVSTLRPANASSGKKGFWHEKQLLLFDSPSLFRPTGSDMVSTPPRAPIFLGEVHGSDLVAVPSSALDTKRLNGSISQSNLLINTHPISGQVINSAENFLLWLPSSGGGQPLVRLRPVRLVKYSIEPMFDDTKEVSDAQEQKKRKHAVRLWRQIYNSGPTHNGWADAKKFLIADYVKTVQLKRSTITDKAVLFNITKEELKKGGE